MGHSDVKTVALHRFGIGKTLFWRRSQSTTSFKHRFGSTKAPLQCHLEKPLRCWCRFAVGAQQWEIIVPVKVMAFRWRRLEDNSGTAVGAAPRVRRLQTTLGRLGLDGWIYIYIY